MSFKRKVLVKREDAGESVLNVKINGDVIWLKVNKDTCFIDVAKYLIEYTPLLESKYQRKAPYKLHVLKRKDENGKFVSSEFNLKYITIENGEFVEHTKYLLKLHSLYMQLKKGEWASVFIPDLLLIMKYLGYVKCDLKGNFEVNGKINSNATFNDSLYLIKDLRDKGFVVPKEFESRLSGEKVKNVLKSS